MKTKIIKVLLVLMVFVSMFGCKIAQEEPKKKIQLSFQWEQSDINVSSFRGWNMWVGTSPEGPYDYIKDNNEKPIPLFEVQYSGDPEGTHVGYGQMLAPANTQTTFYFVLNACCDLVDNPSPYSNEIAYTIDFNKADVSILDILNNNGLTPNSDTDTLSAPVLRLTAVTLF